MTKKAEINIDVRCDAWPDMNARIERAALAALEGAKHGGELSIVLADDAFIQQLNKQYRSKDKPTNVLSFPQDHPDMLGDIILAHETIATEANDQNKSFENHVTHLIVHGVLHLLGLDHEDDKEADEMEALEIKILLHLGIKNPYETGDTP